MGQRLQHYIDLNTTLQIIFLFFVFLIFPNCKKKHDLNSCEGNPQPTGQFVLKEIIGDTSFIADTVFRNNYVELQATDSYENVHWKLGSDPRDWTDANFSLSFYSALGSILIKFTGHKNPNTLCFPNDNGIYTSTRSLTMVEQMEKPILTLSPLIGKYHGYFTDAPADTFTVRIEYFDSSKYDVSITGSKNFYWLSNIPKGFTNASSPALAYPELRNGLSPEMGYKCFVFGASSSSLVQGKGWLSNDSLFINYGNDINGRKKFIGKKI